MASFDFDILRETGASADDILFELEKVMSSDELARFTYWVLQNWGEDIPEELEEYYNLHCRE